MKRTLITLFLLLIGATLADAQETECSTLVQETISTAAEQCGTGGSGEACFGHGPIDAVVNCENAPDFASPGDTLPLDVVCRMRLGALEMPNQWGVAMMRVPISDSGLDATVALLGDVEISNAGSSFSELEAQANQDTTIYSGPGSHYDQIGSLQVDEIVRANACNCTGNWLRVKMDTGEIGWIATRNMTVLGDVESLPGVGVDTPVYTSMQAFTFSSGSQAIPCSDMPESGILIQTPATMHETPIQINGVSVALSSTVFIQSEPGGEMTLEVLDGMASVTVEDFTAQVSAGARATIPMTEDSTPDGMPSIAPYKVDDVLNLPLELLPASVDPTAPLNADTPTIVGIPSCVVVADRGPTVCPLYYLNPDGDAVTQMTVEFVSAPQGEWTGSVRQPPQRIEGDNVSGALAWDSTCSLGGGINFIGPVIWSITITDAEGHVSEPFQAQFNCVEG